jgi:hypothetical protein
MHGRPMVGAALVVAVVLTGLGVADARAQAVTNSDIVRLQDTLFSIGTDIARLRSRDPQLAADLQDQLDGARDEVTYLKVKLRKEGRVSRAEYNDVRDRLEEIRSRALGRPVAPPPRGEQPSRAPVAPPPPPSASSRTPPNEVPAGQELDVRLQSALSSKTAQVEDRVSATTMVDLSKDNRVLIPAGSLVRGVVTSVDPATRTDRKGSLTVSFDRITVRNTSYPIHATVIEALESEGVRGEAGKIGAAAGVGAIIGGILGGLKGALAGILIGGGGVIAATPGEDVDLPPGTVLRIRLDSPLTVETGR